MNDLFGNNRLVIVKVLAFVFWASFLIVPYNVSLGKTLLFENGDGAFDNPFFQNDQLPPADASENTVEKNEKNRPKKSVTDSSQIPLSFEENVGQTDSKVKFILRGNGYNLFLTAAEAILVRNAPDKAADDKQNTSQETKKSVDNVVKMTFPGANPNPRVFGLEPLPGKTNYLLGSDSNKWKNNITNFSRVKYENLYPGIDLVFYAKDQQLEYDFIINPKAGAKSIKLKFEGAESLQIENGDLVLKTDKGIIRHLKPHVYQELATGRKVIKSRYRVKNKNEVVFDIGSYDKNKTLFIDPILSYSTYIGGSDADYGSKIVTDGAGNAYIVGHTSSLNFPTVNAYQTTFAGSDTWQNGDVFVAKLNPTGNAIIYSTYLGGSLDENGLGIAVDEYGKAYVTGMTKSLNFPTKNPFQTATGGGSDAFVAKLNQIGNDLEYSTYLGKSEDDSGQDIAIDSSGNAYIFGNTQSPSFYNVNAVQTTYAGNTDGFVTKINPTGDTIIYSTFLGGQDYEMPGTIKLDSSGNAFVAGTTFSTNFPVSNAFQANIAGASDVFVTKLNSSGNSLLYSTYVGGTDYDYGYGLAIDQSGNVYITGQTSSTNFPILNAYQSTRSGGFYDYSDVFVTKLNSTGNTLLYSTYLGGNDNDTGRAIILDAAGNIYLSGSTSSSNFPTVNPTKATLSGDADAFVTKMNSSGSSISFSTYFGGGAVWVGETGSDSANSIALDPADNIYITGYTTSSTMQTKNAFDSSFNWGQYDAFVARIDKLDDAYSISGTVRDLYGNGISGVTVSLTGDQVDTVQTDNAGNYFFKDLANGDYTVTPSKTNYTFNLSSRSFTDLSSDQAENFTGTSNLYINGQITDGGGAGLQFVKVKLSGTQNGAVYTDSDGNYSFNVAPGGSFTVTPSKFTYAFTPTSQSFNNVTVTQTANFTGAVTTFSISGQILDDDGLPLENAVLSLSGSDSATTQTDAGGNYTLNDIPAGGDYTLTPSLIGYAFTPPFRKIENLSANQILNYVGYTYTISGRITLDTNGNGLPGVTVQLLGYQNETRQTDANGNYSFKVTPGQLYGVYPGKYHYIFTPDSQNFLNIDGDKTANFTATLVYTIRGVITDVEGDGLEYANLNLTGSQTRTALTFDGIIPSGSIRGGYEFLDVPAGGSYTVTPSKSGYTFFPASVSLPNYQSDQTVNFIATRVYNITGRVTNGSGTGVSGVTIALNGSATSTKTTNANGDYSFTKLAAGGSYTITPAKTNTIFAPQSKSISNLSADETADFVSSSSLTISGRLANSAGTGVSAATVLLSGSESRTVQTDANGNYTFSGLNTGGSYWITPSKAGVGFTPRSKYLENLTTSQTVNFISGTVDAAILNPIADAHVKDGASASTNFGTVTPLEVRTSSTANDGNTRDSYLKYDLSQLTTQTGTVKLRLYASLSAAGALSVSAYGVSNTTWIESGTGSITWSNKPALGSSLGSVSITSTTNTWYEVDVTNYVKAELAAGRSLITLGLHNAAASTNNIRINSKEATSNRPELLITPESIVNNAPSVNAGPDQIVALPSAVSLDASVSDDGNPTTSTLTTTWTKVSGPGTVAFGNAAAADTTATFSLSGTYVLQLTANDGALSANDQIQITVNPVPGTVTLNPTADAHVRDGTNNNTNYGSAALIEVRTDSVVNSGNNRDAYLKFNITTATNPVGSAKLRIYASLSASGTVNTSVYPVTNTTWIETGTTGIKWSNKPAMGTPALSTVGVTGTTYGWYELDVTSYVMNEKQAGRNTITLGLRNPSASTPNTRFNSKESATNKPELIVVPSTASTSPKIINFLPYFGMPGTIVTIKGLNFGAAQGASTVKFNGVTAAPTSWNNTTIVTPVPAAATTGPVVVTVGGVASPGVIFTVAATETDTDADGLGDSWERMYFGNLTQTGTGDFDGDGSTNLQEYQQGRNPTLRAVFDTDGSVNLKVYTPLDFAQ